MHERGQKRRHPQYRVDGLDHLRGRLRIRAAHQARLHGLEGGLERIEGGVDAADPATFAAFRPRVAVLNNGPRKGGAPETLRAFHFDVVTVDLTGNADSWAASALDVASVAFLLWPNSADRRLAWEAGIRWELHLEMDGERLDWSLEPLHF